MEHMMVSLNKANGCSARAEGLQDYGNMKETADLTARQAAGLEETQKGNIEMKRYNHMTGHRIRGWLMVIPIRLAAGMLCLPLLVSNTVLAILYILVLGCCAALFTLHRRGFRAVYIGAAAFGLALGIASLPGSVVYLAVQVAVEIVLIPALYMSKRVKDTFFACSREAAYTVDGWKSPVRERSCYDTYMTTYRITR